MRDRRAAFARLDEVAETGWTYRKELAALAHLHALPAGKRTRFEPFADKLIGAGGGLTWTAPNANATRLALHGTIRRMILSILNDCGAAQLEYQKRRLGKRTISELAALRITPFGK